MKEQQHTIIQHHNGSDTQQMILDLLEQMSLALMPSSLSTMQDLQENVEKMKKKAQRDRALRAEQQRRHEQDLENLRLQQSVRIEPKRDQFISEYWIDDQRVTIEAGKIRTVRTTAAVTASERAPTSRTEHVIRYTDQQTRALNDKLDQALRRAGEARIEFETVAIATATTNQRLKRDDVELYSEYEQFKQNMRRLREQADADQEHAATMQQQYQFDREHSAELTATILQLAKLVEEIVSLMMHLIAAMLGQQYNIQSQPQVESKQQKPNDFGAEF